MGNNVTTCAEIFSASTAGTPELNNTDKVLAQRAVAPSRKSRPITGKRNSKLCQRYFTASRIMSHLTTIANTNSTPSNIPHHSTNQLLVAINPRVSGGNSCLKWVNMVTTLGTTTVSKNTTIPKDKVSIMIG